MKKIKIPIGKLFEKIINEPIDKNSNEKMYNTNTDIYIETPFGFKKILLFVTKKTDTYEYKLENNKSIKISDKHLIFDNNKLKKIKNAKYVDNIDGNSYKIIDKKIIKKNDIAYDIMIDNPHIYNTPDGSLHHNTTVAMIMFLYDMCRFLTMECPQCKFKLQASAKLVGVLVNSTLEAAQRVNFDPLMSLIRNSPFFVGKLNNKNKTSLFINNIDIVMATRKRALVGLNAFTILFDEIARFESVKHGLAKEMISEGINRINSRFLIKGNKWPSVPTIISSADADGSIIADLSKMAKDGKLGIDEDNILQIQASRYEVKAGVTDYSGETFKIFVGNYTADPFIIEDEKDLERAEKLKTSDDEIKDVPIEHKPEFMIDIYSGIRDVIGLNISNTKSFIYSKDALRKSISLSTIVPDEVTLPNDFKLIDYFNTKKIDYLKPGAKYVLGMDIALSGDRFGIALGHIHDLDKNKDIIVYIDFAFGIIPTENQKLKLSDIRQFIYDLDELGVDIEYILMDSFQSTDMKQILEDNGYKVKINSVDRKKEPYYEMRNMIVEERLFLPQNKILNIELLNLKEYPDKIDHPDWNPDGTKGGKDISDAVCQVVYGLNHLVKYSPTSQELLEVSNNKSFLEELQGTVYNNFKKENYEILNEIYNIR